MFTRILGPYFPGQGHCVKLHFKMICLSDLVSNLKKNCHHGNHLCRKMEKDFSVHRGWSLQADDSTDLEGAPDSVFS